MKIKKIKYENFRNFKEPGTIEFSNDGKVTLIYGGNGAGKTTFHQLFQWIIYGETHFNKTAGTEMYNLEYESKVSNDTQFSVKGEIEFEQKNCLYRIIRKWTYEKHLIDTSYVSENFVVMKQAEDGGWNPLPKPEDVVEQLLPIGLSNYFFFDGEGMIADLKAKSKDSAISLKNALYLLLGLDVYDKAVDIIGDIDKRTTVLGMLYDGITKDTTDSDVVKLRIAFKGIQDRKDNYQKKLDDLKEQKAKKNNRVQEISEQIGSSTKTHAQYEKDRKHCQELVNDYKKLIDANYKSFGEAFVKVFPRIMMAKVSERASIVLKKHDDESKFLPGINKELVDALMNRDICVCGNVLTQKEKECLNKLYKYLPPRGYDALYRNFIDKVTEWGREYDSNVLESYIINIGKYNDEIKKQEEEMTNIDKKIAMDLQYNDLITERLSLNNKVNEIDEDIGKISQEIQNDTLRIKKLMSEIDKKTALSDSNRNANRKITIMQAVKEHFQNLIKEGSKEYSKELQDNIVLLLGQMMEAERNVEVHDDFSLRVFDQYGSESKSEGQFASVSFAYICGIFKLLQEKEMLKNKEYPLVLDAPFSKLSDYIRRKVINVLPKYAPQVIIMSKDIIHELFEKDEIGKIYEIYSNAEQNVAWIEEREVE